MLNIQDLRFSYGQRRRFFGKAATLGPVVIREASLAIGAGELFGLVGPNGAGKSTLIKLVMGILTPQNGSVAFEGRRNLHLDDMPWRSQIGFLSGAATKLFSTLTLSEHLLLYGRLYKRFDVDWITQAMRMMHLGAKLDRMPSSISFGERIKFELLLTLACKPRLLLLDEPTVGLDPIAIDEIRSLVAAYTRSHQATGIVTSHNLHDIVTMCSRGGFLLNGTLNNQFDSGTTSAAQLETLYKRVFGRTHA